MIVRRRITSLFILTLAMLASMTTADLLRAQDQPLKVYILAGQSNMQGHAHVRTLQHLAMSEDTRGLLGEIQEPDGGPKAIERVWISSLSNGGEKHGILKTGYGATEEKIGPELTFGIQLRKSTRQPILLIKTAWGGKSLHTDFRPPSAGSYELNANQKDRLTKQGKDVQKVQQQSEAASGVYYRLMMRHIQSVLVDPGRICPEYDATKGYELAGFVWFQGWNDMVDGGVYPNRGEPGGYSMYSDLLSQFIRDVRSDLDAPELPFVIGVMGVNGPTENYTEQQRRYIGIHQGFRDAMAAPAASDEFRDHVIVVKTEEFWDAELSSLRQRESMIRQAVRQWKHEQNLDRQAEEREFESRKAAALSVEERTILDSAISNAEYHYLGSAKILGNIGIAFAQALTPAQ